MPSRQNQKRVTVVLDGVNLGVWDNRTGGDSDSNSVQYDQGGMGGRRSLGGSPMVANVIIETLETDFILSQRKFMRARTGKGNVVVTDQPLDDEGNPISEPEVFTGKWKRFKSSDTQAAGSNNAATCEAEIEVDGPVA